MFPSPAECEPAWEFDCPKWRDLRRADEADEADSWFGQPVQAVARDPSQHFTETARDSSHARTASSGQQQQQQHQRAASASQHWSDSSQQSIARLGRVKHASDSLLCLSQPSHSSSHYVYPVLPVRSVTPLTQPEPFQLSTERRASRAVASNAAATSERPQLTRQPQPHSVGAAASNKENKRSAVCSQPRRPQSHSTKHRAATSSAAVSDVVKRLYGAQGSNKPQPLAVRTNRTEPLGRPVQLSTSGAMATKSSRPVQSRLVRAAPRTSIAASPLPTPCPSPRPPLSPRQSPTSSPLCSVRRITRPVPFRLASDVRAEQRREWDAARQAVSAQRSATQAAADTERVAAERVDRHHLRHSLVHQPLAMPAFDTVFVPEKSRHALTAPASPRLQTKLRASAGQPLKQQQPHSTRSSNAQWQRASSRW